MATSCLCKVFSFPDSNQALRRAGLGYRAPVAAQRTEYVVIGDTLVEYDVAHHADTLLAVEPAGLQFRTRKTTSSSRCQKWTCPLCSSCPTQHLSWKKAASFAQQNNRTTNILKSLLADWDAKKKTVHSGDSADLLVVPKAEKEGVGQGMLVPQTARLRLLSPTGKIVLSRK